MKLLNYQLHVPFIVAISMFGKYLVPDLNNVTELLWADQIVLHRNCLSMQVSRLNKSIIRCFGFLWKKLKKGNFGIVGNWLHCWIINYMYPGNLSTTCTLATWMFGKYSIFHKHPNCQGTCSSILSPSWAVSWGCWSNRSLSELRVSRINFPRLRSSTFVSI